jgi:hypothetical protein
MYPRRDDRSGRYGYWSRDRWAIGPQFSYAHNFVSGYAAVTLLGGGYGLIGKDDRTLVNLEAICGGRKPVQEELYSFAGFGVFDSQPSNYATICTVNHGRREWGLIDTSLTYRPLPNEVFSKAAGVNTCGNTSWSPRRAAEAASRGMGSLTSATCDWSFQSSIHVFTIRANRYGWCHGPSTTIRRPIVARSTM